MQGLENKEIAVVGVSDKQEKFGFKIFRDLLEKGFRVQGVNPRAIEVLGRKTYKSLKELPKAPDLVITVVPAEVTEKIVQECKMLGIKEIWMQPGSDSQEAVKNAQEAGIKVTHNACFMVRYGIW